MRQAGEAHLRGRKKGGGIGGRWTLQNYGRLDPEIGGENGRLAKNVMYGKRWRVVNKERDRRVM